MKFKRFLKKCRVYFAKRFCFRCGGTGTFNDGSTCYYCNGTGVIDE